MRRTAAALAITMFGTGFAAAQDLAPKVTRFAKQELQGTVGREVTLQTLDLQPGSATDLQTHPGDDIGAVLEGTVLVGQGDETMKEIKAGEAFVVAPNTPVRIKNASDKPARLVTVWILQKDAPPSTTLPPGK